MNKLEKKLQYTFNNKNLLKEAVTHSSYTNETHNSVKCNERLEFLGDAVLSIISAQFLFEKFPELPEGNLSKIRSSLVCTQSLSAFAREIELGSFMLFGKGEAATGGAERPSILEDAFEAVIGAIYLDGGMEPARDFVLRFLGREIENKHTNFKDYKTTLQEIVQQNPDERLNYVPVGESGPDHDKRFQVELHINSNVIASGIGRSKKQAEQDAARQALELMGYNV